MEMALKCCFPRICFQRNGWNLLRTAFGILSGIGELVRSSECKKNGRNKLSELFGGNKLSLFYLQQNANK